ncbi:MAG: MFS transporter [Candidatus Methylomirabilia bacterium]
MPRGRPGPAPGDQSPYAWVILVAAMAMVAIGIGSLFSLGVFLQPIGHATGWSRSSISAIALFNWIVMGAGSLLWGFLSDRFSPRLVALAGGILVGLGLVLTSQTGALWQFAGGFGLLVALGVSALVVPMVSTVTRWFTALRALAVGLVWSGSGLGVLVISPLTQWLISAFGWRNAMLMLGVLAWVTIIPAALLIRDRPEGGVPDAPGGAGAPEAAVSTAGALRSPVLWTIAFTHFACCAAHSGPIFHMVACATGRGLAPMTAASVFGVSGLSSIAGRIGLGLLADRLGIKWVLVTGLFAQALMILSYVQADDVWTFYALAAPFGVTYGGVMPLYAVLTREYFGEKVMGTAYGAVFFIACVGMGMGSFAGGWIYDQLGSYTWLFLTSSVVGTMAALLAVTLRPPRARHP